MCMTEKFWEAFIAAIGGGELRSDPRFSTPALRHRHRHALTAVLDGELRKRSTAEWLALLSGLLPVAPVLDVDEALDQPFVGEVGMVKTVAHAARADFRVLANPLKIDGQRLEQVAARSLGADNALLDGEPKARP
jgi:crotonobetainyl-CoA:carnitine CoA-transferase CaiB-like acyl-CoA transferase